MTKSRNGSIINIELTDSEFAAKGETFTVKDVTSEFTLSEDGTAYTKKYDVRETNWITAADGKLQKTEGEVSARGILTLTTDGKNLTGANLRASDLRAGASLVIAALMANGVSTIDNIYHIDRGYELLENKFRMIGADIQRINEEDTAVITQNKGNLSESQL